MLKSELLLNSHYFHDLGVLILTSIIIEKNPFTVLWFIGSGIENLSKMMLYRVL